MLKTGDFVNLSETSSDFRDIENSLDPSSVKFLVSQGNPTMDVLLGNKLVLASESVVFQMMFLYIEDPAYKNFFSESTDEVEIDDIRLDVFQEFLKNLHSTSEILLITDEITVELALGVLYAANKYIIPYLAVACDEFLLSNVSSHDVLMVEDFYYRTQLMSCVKTERMLAVCHCIFDIQSSRVIRGRRFRECNEGQLCRFLQRDNLSTDEISLFQALVAWGSNSLQQKNGTTCATIRNEIQNAVMHVRFPIMSLREFTQVVIQENVLTSNELLNVYMTMGSVNAGGVGNLGPSIFPVKKRHGLSWNIGNGKKAIEEMRKIIHAQYGIFAPNVPLIHTAALGSSVFAFRYLLPMQYSHQNQNGDTVLHKLVLRDMTQKVLYMFNKTLALREVKTIINQTNNLGLTPLYSVQSPDVLGKLLDNGADPEYRNRAGFRALDVKAYFGELEFVRVYLQKSTHKNQAWLEDLFFITARSLALNNPNAANIRETLQLIRNEFSTSEVTELLERLKIMMGLTNHFQFVEAIFK